MLKYLSLNALVGICRFIMGLSYLIWASLAGSARAAELTNEVWCAPTNFIYRTQVGNPQIPSTLRMIERLNRIREAPNPGINIFLNDQRAELIEKGISLATNPSARISLTFQLAGELLQAGRTEAALKAYEATEAMLAVTGNKLDLQSNSKLRMNKATTMLRLGEQENCIGNHNAESCLFPLTPAAFHQLPRGSRGAVALLTEQLNELPQDRSAGWLLNLAYMTLGEYPDKVPAKWVIPPKVFQSDYDFPRFPDVAGALGVDVNGLAGGCILDDFDNDGLTDIMTSSWGLDGGFLFFRNDGNGRFTDRTEAAGLSGLMGGLNIQQTDYNNDSLLDIWVLRGAWTDKLGRIPASLLRNNGDGTFADVTEEAGLLRQHPTQTSVWFDFDGDGWLDVFIGNESTDPNDPDPSELYQNNRNGTFKEVAAICGIQIKRFVKGVTSADYDNDGRPDLYISCRNSENLLFHNDGADASGRWKFSDVTKRAGVKASVTFPTWFFDYNNDGWEDIFVSGYSVDNVGDIAADYLGLPNEGVLLSLYHNNRDGTFTDVAAQMRLNRVVLTMGCNFGDLDNDGWLDFYLGTGNPELTMVAPNRMFRNAEGKFFQDVTTAGGFGHLQKGHGVGFADLDNDGDQDIYEIMGGAFVGDTSYNVLFHNPGNTNRWLKLKLIGAKSNRAAIGARIHVTVQTPTGPRHIFRTVNSGGSFGSSPLRQEIGLGCATKIETVEIKWPASGIQQVLKGLELDQSYHVFEGNPQVSVLNLKPIKFDVAATNSHHSHQMKMRAGNNRALRVNQ